MSKLSHFDESGAVNMVDVSEKVVSKRRAVASGRVLMSETTLAILRSQTNPKGDPLEIARIAGAMDRARLVDWARQILAAS